MNALLQRHTPARLVKIMIARKGIELGWAREDLAQPNGRAAMNGATKRASECGLSGCHGLRLFL